MRSTLFFVTLLTILAVAGGPANAGRPVYAVAEHKEVTIASINAKGKSIRLTLPSGGSHQVAAGPKTWFFKDGDEASFDDLRVGQRLHVRYIPRTSQAITVDVLPPKGEK